MPPAGHRPHSLFAAALVAGAATLVAGCGEKSEDARSRPEPESPAVSGDASGASPTVTLEPVVASAAPSLAPILERVDARRDDGWDTEVLSAAAQDALANLLEPLESGEPFTATDPQLPPLRPPELDEAFSDGQLLVRRGAAAGDSHAVPFREALASLREPYAPDARLHLKLKTVHVRPLADDRFATDVLFLADGPGAHGTVQQNARWQCTWNAGEPPTLLDLAVTDHEEIVPQTNASLRFEDLTASAFRHAPSFAAQLMRGVDHWRPRLQGDFGVDVNGLQGIAIGDADGDGLDDVYLCQQGGLPNKLYLRNADGTLRDVSAVAGVDWMEVTRAALFVDLDNDGDQDLVLAQGWYWMLMENDSKGVFTKRGETRAPANLHSLAAADYDLDGDLDLFFCGRNPARELEHSEGILGQPMPYHDANNGGANILLRNDGQWQFTDATVAAGLDQNNRRYSYACAWIDYDLDGDPDLYVANDFGRNNLYRNDGGTFTDVAAELGVEDMSAGMGVTWGDYNNDGRPDLYVSNMFSSAGNRITYQRQFRDGSDAANAPFQRHARGNTLFSNNAAGFADVSEAAAVTMGRWAWGNKFVDLNNDGWEDLYVANGFITTEDPGDL